MIIKDNLNINHKLQNKKYTILTAIFDNYDLLRTPDNIDPDANYICITDNKHLKSNFWSIIIDNKTINPDWSGRKKTYYVRYHPFNYCNSEYCFWLDSSIKINILDFSQFLNKELIVLDGLLIKDYIEKFILCYDKNVSDLYNFKKLYVKSISLINIVETLYKNINHDENEIDIKAIPGCFRGYKNTNTIINILNEIYNKLLDIDILKNANNELTNIGNIFANDILYYDEIISGIYFNNLNKYIISYTDFFKNLATIYEHNTLNIRQL